MIFYCKNFVNNYKTAYKNSLLSEHLPERVHYDLNAANAAIKNYKKVFAEENDVP